MSSLRFALSFAFVGLFTTVAGAATYVDAVNALNPLSYYQFNGTIASGGTATDDGSRAANVTYSGGVSVGAGVPGIGGQSLSLAGAANAVGTDAGLPIGNADRTVAMWIRSTDPAATTYNVTLFYGNTGNGNSVFVFVPANSDTNSNPSGSSVGITGNKGNFGVSQYGQGLGGTTWVNDGNWHFVAYTQTANGGANADYRVYVDGQLDGGFAGYGGPKTLQSNTTLAGSSGLLLGTDSLGDQYSGDLAQVAIFGSALSATQIHDLYATAVPEPVSASMGSLAALALAFMRRSRQTR